MQCPLSTQTAIGDFRNQLWRGSDRRGHAVPAIGIDTLVGPSSPPCSTDDLPRAGDDIVLGTRTLRQAHLAVSDRVTLSVPGGNKEMHIVGRAVLPKLGQGSFSPTDLGEGAAVKASVLADPDRATRR